jgi:stage II sporulation protein E
MTVKGKIEDIRKAAEGAVVDVNSAQMKSVVMAGLNFLIAFLMSAARIAGNAAPFGVSAVAQAGPGLSGICALAGAVLGYLSIGGLEWGVKYAAAAVLVFTVRFVLQDIKVCKRQWFMPLSALVVMALAGILGSFSADLSTEETIVHICVESVLAALGTYFFREALSSEERSTESAEFRHEAALAVFIGCALASVSRVEILDVISLGRLGALLVVMTAALKGGPALGAAAGTVLGVLMDACSGGVPFFTMSYALCGLLSGVFGKHGRLLFLFSFILADAFAVLCAWKWSAAKRNV